MAGKTVLITGSTGGLGRAVALRLGGEGARAVVNLALSPELQGRSGRYYDGLRKATADPQAYDRRARERLDRLSCQLTGLPPANTGSE